MPNDDRLVATVRCKSCAWLAEFTGDDVADIVPSLDRIIAHHIRTEHPDNLHPPIVVLSREA
jgi:hypothetical protein